MTSGLAGGWARAGPPEVWPGALSGRLSPLPHLLFPGTENSAEDLETGLDAVTAGTTSRRPSLRPPLFCRGPMSSGRRGVSRMPRRVSFLPRLLTVACKGDGHQTQTEAGTSVSELEGSLVQMGQQRWREGRHGPAQ